MFTGGAFRRCMREAPSARPPTKPSSMTFPPVLSSRVMDSAHGTLVLRRDIRLASLREPDLAKWNISRSSLIGSSPKLYPQTAAWAKAVHDQFPEVEGLVWTNQCDPDDACLFFGGPRSDRGRRSRRISATPTMPASSSGTGCVLPTSEWSPSGTAGVILRSSTMCDWPDGAPASRSCSERSSLRCVPGRRLLEYGDRDGRPRNPGAGENAC